MNTMPQLVNYNEIAFKQLYADLFSKPDLILRAEQSPDEHRTPLIPSHLSFLKESFHVLVESSSTRCYTDDAYQRVGAVIVRPGYWESSTHSFVIGLKAIHAPANATQTLMHFAHCFYQQKTAVETLKNLSACRFIDYETLLHPSGERALSFCKPSGKVGCYLALMTYFLQLESMNGKRMELPPFEEGLYRETLLKAVMEGRFSPRILIIGFGTVGKSAKEVLDQLGLECTIWKRSDPKSTTTLLNHTIVLHAIRLRNDHSDGIFLSLDQLDQPRQLRVVCDISCDLGHPLNPLPLYTSFTNPIERLREDPPLDLIAIDHLPSLEPVISSNVFSSILKHYLVQLPYFHYQQGICPLSSQLAESHKVFLWVCNEKRIGLESSSQNEH
jgi:saccharopine dehydrogenase (NAD+, L-lysine-forming)